MGSLTEEIRKAPESGVISLASRNRPVRNDWGAPVGEGEFGASAGAEATKWEWETDIRKQADAGVRELDAWGKRLYA